MDSVFETPFGPLFGFSFCGSILESNGALKGGYGKHAAKWVETLGTFLVALGHPTVVFFFVYSKCFLDAGFQPQTEI